MTGLDNYQEAKKRVKEKKGFYLHLGYYLSIMGSLVLINMFNFRGTFWFVYPAIGWGISLVIHYLVVFGAPWMTFWDNNWEEKAIQKEMEKLERLDAYKHKQTMQQPMEEWEELPLKDFKKVPQKKWDDLV